MSDIDRPGIDRILRGLCWAGIVCWFMISATDIHRWRVWGDFDAAFSLSARILGGTSSLPLWLYAIAFPFVAANFACLVQILRGRRRGILPVFAISSLVIAAMPLIAGQWVLYRLLVADIFTALGFAIGGAIALILYLGLDTRSHALYGRRP
ncbi:MAG: hypothetical protein ACXIT4_09855 [Erythrobacter sp.]